MNFTYKCQRVEIRIHILLKCRELELLPKHLIHIRKNIQHIAFQSEKTIRKLNNKILWFQKRLLQLEIKDEMDEMNIDF